MQIQVHLKILHAEIKVLQHVLQSEFPIQLRLHSQQCLETCHWNLKKGFACTDN